MVRDLRKEIRDESNLEKAIREVKQIAHLIANPVEAMTSGFRFHKVEVDGEPCWAADAKVINRVMGSRGRGNYRHLIAMRTREYLGIAEHTAHGEYRLTFSFSPN